MLDDFAGLGRRKRGLAACMALFLLSLAGFRHWLDSPPNGISSTLPLRASIWNWRSSVRGQRAGLLLLFARHLGDVLHRAAASRRQNSSEWSLRVFRGIVPVPGATRYRRRGVALAEPTPSPLHRQLPGPGILPLPAPTAACRRRMRSPG